MRSPKASGPITPAIRRLLQYASRGPEELERLVAAYKRALGLKDRNDPVPEDAEEISKLAIKELGTS
jgi:hypothetical protein